MSKKEENKKKKLLIGSLAGIVVLAGGGYYSTQVLNHHTTNQQATSTSSNISKQQKESKSNLQGIEDAQQSKAQEKNEVQTKSEKDSPLKVLDTLNNKSLLSQVTDNSDKKNKRNIFSD